ncbi:uncharacterized protein acoxl isoform X3 [Acipenser ruthenus]|uniref:uncharacterized protein acoxl isoform X3 n=1 Tax=Acipenser ruthenus TaxID=7906 RepID=UPI00145A6967|nr:uncharacterized protein acoxl isoform X3 [Acipenser ruthenus]
MVEVISKADTNTAVKVKFPLVADVMTKPRIVAFQSPPLPLNQPLKAPPPLPEDPVGGVTAAAIYQRLTQQLLGKFGSVSPGGVYQSPIKSKEARFSTMLATLTPARLALTVQAMEAMKIWGKCHE